MTRVIYHPDEPRHFNSSCPLCGAQIKWALTPARPGAEGQAICTKSVKASQILENLRDCKGCAWEGVVVRQKDGGVRFMNRDGTWLRG